MSRKSVFVLGRRTPRSRVVVLAGAKPPIRGPFTLRAVVTGK